MNKAIKIFVGIIVFLGILSVIFLLTSKKQTVATQPIKKQTMPVKKTTVPNSVTPSTLSTQPANNQTQATSVATDHKTLIRSQWQQCKSKTLPISTNLFWNIQITEPIPTGGTYAKGFLDNDQTYPVHVIIKADAPTHDKINANLVAGKVAIVRGNCVDVAKDGAVVVQAF